ncbi:alpha/beta-hydrolase [Fragilariopsis cylindrus CCMP1102]|uniref:Alpha/beta-hydrolase n=1 Tax=Fragilariopsis cylindrus CCMP1102 TaxID=635003 RepID=A0A1E7FD73_9STRA|nr:alpha/beta-hydrolase [Fragilariopsis cylindrus CCMP1102]|eukprot:OEU16076.1 alpha/beta-hydrolase [Fragilariopsis cylindrus CCMP1102]
MLPSHLLDPTKKKNERPSHTRLGQAPPAPPPSLCVTGAMSRMGRYQVRMNGNDNNNEDPIVLSYCIFRPRQLYDDNKPPLLCIHGGPSIPSNYLLPIVNVVTDRSVIFYDQWGCGKSSRPRSRPKSKSKESESGEYYPPFSIPIMVEHLRQLTVEHWKLKKFHLLGHSFGGILAYEYFLLSAKPLKTKTKQLDEEENDENENENEEYSISVSSVCCSLILSSTPTSAALIQSESERLLQDLNNNNDNDNDSYMYTTTTKESSNDGTNDDDDNDDDNNNDEEKILSTTTEQQQTHRQKNQKIIIQKSTKTKKKKSIVKKIKYTEEFHQTHECRLSSLPLVLMDALRQVGPIPWRGIQAIEGYDIFDTTNKESNEIKTSDTCSSSNNNIQEQVLEQVQVQVQVFPPTLLMRGEYDFCTELYENLYGKEILQFIQTHDNSTEMI